MELLPINTKDLISGGFGDDTTHIKLVLHDYDWMNYSLSTGFHTTNQGQISISFEYLGTIKSYMKVQQIVNGNKNKSVTYSYLYEFDSQLFFDYLTKYMEQHMKTWNNNTVFDGEPLVIEFYNKVLEIGELYVS